MKIQPLNRLAYVILCACATLGGLTTCVHAANEIWSATAADGAWETGANWVSGNAPGANTGTTSPDVATLKTGSTRLTVLPDLGRNIFGITFDTSAVGAYVIGATGGNALLLSDGGTIQNTTAVNANQTFLAPLAFQGSYTFTANSTASSNGKILIFSNVVGTASSGVTNTLTLNGVNTGSNIIKSEMGDGAGGGSLSLVKSGTGKWVLAGTNTFSGGVTLNAGTLTIGNNTAIGTGSFTVNGGAIRNESSYTFVNNNPHFWNGNFIVSYPMSSLLSLGKGSVTLSTNITVTMGADSWGSTWTVPGNIGDNGGSRSLTVKAGGSNAGVLNLSGTNTYSGGTIMEGAGIRIGNIRALGTGPLIINGGAISQTTGGAALVGVSEQTWGGNFGISATSGGVNLGASPVTLTNNVRITLDNGPATFGGVISGTNNLILTLQGTSYSSQFYLQGTNTFVGGLTILPGTATLTVYAYNSQAFGNGPLTLSRGAGGTLQLVNSVSTLTSIITSNQYWNANLTLAGNNSVRLEAPTFTLGTNVIATVNTATLTVSGPISGSNTWYSLTKAGLGTLVLSSTNTYEGGTIVTNGTLTVESTGTLGGGNVFVGTNATLRLLTSSAISNTATVQLATVGSKYAKAYLTNGVLNVVSGVIIDGTLYDIPGTYGSTASGAKFPFDNNFTGEGKLWIIPHPTIIRFF